MVESPLNHGPPAPASRPARAACRLGVVDDAVGRDWRLAGFFGLQVFADLLIQLLRRYGVLCHPAAGAETDEDFLVVDFFDLHIVSHGLSPLLCGSMVRSLAVVRASVLGVVDG